MKCLCPISVKDPQYNMRKKFRNDMFGTYYTQYNLVPCGKCYNCIVNKRSQWAFRLYQESLSSQSNYFITLTYDDNNLHWTDNYATLDPQFIQKWLKNLVQYCRKYFNCVVKYYLCGEYGWQSGRPHYHLHLFNLPTSVDIYDFISSRWKLGNFFIGSTNCASGMYVTKHNLVKLLPDQLNPNYEVEQIVPPFMRCSKGIGLNYLDSLFTNYDNVIVGNVPNSVPFENKSIPTPRYYKDFFKDRYSMKYIAFTQMKRFEDEQRQYNDIDYSSVNYDRDLPYLDNWRSLGFESKNEFDKYVKRCSVQKRKSLFDASKYTIERLLDMFSHNVKV